VCNDAGSENIRHCVTRKPMAIALVATDWAGVGRTYRVVYSGNGEKSNSKLQTPKGLRAALRAADPSRSSKCVG